MEQNEARKTALLVYVAIGMTILYIGLDAHAQHPDDAVLRETLYQKNTKFEIEQSPAIRNDDRVKILENWEFVWPYIHSMVWPVIAQAAEITGANEEIKDILAKNTVIIAGGSFPEMQPVAVAPAAATDTPASELPQEAQPVTTVTPT